VVDGTIAIAGVPVRLLDTAGLDVPSDAIEAEGIRRSRRAMEESDLLLVVLDGSILPDQRVLEETADRARVIVRAKCDLPAHPAAAAHRDAVAVSAVSGEGIEALLERLAQEVEDRAAAAGDEGGIVASLRQFELLHALSTSLAAGECALGEAPLEAALVDLKDALNHAGAVLGVDVGDAVLDHIFETFCLGK
jgi:tRNA modification GTPase